MFDAIRTAGPLTPRALHRHKVQRCEGVKVHFHVHRFVLLNEKVTRILEPKSI